MIRSPLDQRSEVVDQRRRWTSDWYSWLAQLVDDSNGELDVLTQSVTDLTQAVDDINSKFDIGSLVNAVDDTAAATAGVAVGEIYRNGSILMIRVA